MLPFLVLILASSFTMRCIVQRRKRKAFHIIGLLVMLLCVSGAASAATIHDVPESRISIRLPAGMIAQAHTSAGRLNLTIDSKNTDWGRVLLQGNDTSYVDVVAGIKAPNGAVYYVMESSSGNTEEDVLSWLDDYECEDYSTGTLAENGQFVAQCINEYRIVMPYNESTYLYVRWFDAGYEAIRTEKLHFTSNHTMSEGVYAPLYQIHSDSIVPNYSNHDGITANVTAGEVTYTITGKPGSSGDQITTAVCVPAGTATCNLLNLYEGHTPLTIENGYVLLNTDYPQTGAPKTTFGLEFLDNTGALISCGTLAVQHQTKEMAPWPAYVANWKTVPPENLLVAIDGNSGVRMPYESGILSYDFSQIVDDPKALDGSYASISVIPPKNAKYVRQNCMGGGEGLLGVPWNGGADADEIMQWMDAETVSGAVSVGQWPVLQHLNTYDGVTLFVPTVPTNLDAGLAYLLYWYEDEESLNNNQPSEVWWFAEKSAPFVKVTEYGTRKSEADLPKRYDGAIVIGGENWTITTEHYLQKGKNAQHYELRLTDEHGNSISPNRNTVVYLPYPDGLSFDDDMTYTLRHYDAQGGSETVTSLTPTEKGLRFEVNTLSPFVLQWDEQHVLTNTPEPPVADLPQTGDNTPIEWLIALLLLSAFGFVCMLQNKRRA